jgi:hypothetical protein
MASKKISQLPSGSLAIPLSGQTAVVYSGITHQQTLSSLRQILVDSGSHHFTGSQFINGNLVVTGSIIAQEYIISSSVSHITVETVSGSSNFGDTLNDNHNFTGSVKITGSLNVNGNVGYTGSLKLSGSLNVNGKTSLTGSVLIGTGSFETDNPEILHVENSGSFNVVHLQANNQYYAQINLKNTNSGNNASGDFVITADNGNEGIHYVDLGINSSTYTGGLVGAENDAYLLNVGNDLYIGTVGGGFHPGDVRIFTQNSWQEPQIAISGSGQIMFNTGSVSNGFEYEFSGSVKLDNDLKVDGAIETDYLYGNAQQWNYLALNGSVSGAPDVELGSNNNISLWAEGGTVNVTGSLIVSGTIDTNGYDINTNGGNLNGVIANVSKLHLSDNDPLPSGILGDLAVSGSNLYFYNGTEWKEVSFGGAINNPTPTPTPSPTMDVTPTSTPTPTPTSTMDVTPTPTPSSTMTVTPTSTPTPTVTPTLQQCNTTSLIAINANITANSAIKTSGGGWDSSAYSTETYSGPVTLTFQASDNGNYLMGGFSVNPTLNSETYLNTTYGFYLQNNFLEIYEYGAQVTVPGYITTLSTDVWKIIYNGATVTYYQNDNLIYTSTNPVTQPLHVYFALLTGNKGVTNICAKGTVDSAPTPTPTPTTTLTPTPSSVSNGFYYSANSYVCYSTGCQDPSYCVVNSTTPLTVGQFYKSPTESNITYEILSLIANPNYSSEDLTGISGFADCFSACYQLPISYSGYQYTLVTDPGSPQYTQLKFTENTTYLNNPNLIGQYDGDGVQYNFGFNEHDITLADRTSYFYHMIMVQPGSDIIIWFVQNGDAAVYLAPRGNNNFVGSHPSGTITGGRFGELDNWILLKPSNNNFITDDVNQLVTIGYMAL